MPLKQRVLLADDDGGFRAIVTHALRDEYVVQTACDGQEAFLKAVETRPDVILLDLGMPGWDGLETLQELRRSPIVQGVPVMALTGDNRKQTVHAVIKAGANDYTLKETFHESPNAFRKKLKQLAPPIAS